MTNAHASTAIVFFIVTSGSGIYHRDEFSFLFYLVINTSHEIHFDRHVQQPRQHATIVRDYRKTLMYTRLLEKNLAKIRI